MTAAMSGIALQPASSGSRASKRSGTRRTMPARQLIAAHPSALRRRFGGCPFPHRAVPADRRGEGASRRVVLDAIDREDDLLAGERIRADRADDDDLALLVVLDRDVVTDAPMADLAGRQRAGGLSDAVLLGPVDVALDVLQAGIGARRDTQPNAGRHGRFLGDRVGDAGPRDARHVGRGGGQQRTAMQSPRRGISAATPEPLSFGCVRDCCAGPRFRSHVRQGTAQRHSVGCSTRSPRSADKRADREDARPDRE